MISHSGQKPLGVLAEIWLFIRFLAVIISDQRAERRSKSY